jgi:signal peptidase I
VKTISTSRRRTRRIGGAVSALASLAVLAVAVTMLVPPLLGYERYVITGGSMAGTYDRGSVVFADRVPVEDLRVGDAITYSPPEGASADERITHRIAAIRRDPMGNRLFRTKGDANGAADPWRFRLDEPVQARVAFHVPYAGFPIMALADRTARILAIGLPALLIALSLLVRLWREAGMDARRGTEASA